MIEIIERKKKYGSLNHNTKAIGSEAINNMFNDPEAFLDGLQTHNYVVAGSIEESRFFTLIGFNGPMYKVFSDEEIRAWQQWVLSLGQVTVPTPVITDPGILMSNCIEYFRSQQKGTPTHDAVMLTGPDPDNPTQDITQPVSFWFTKSPRVLMSVLANPTNGWIVSGASLKSKIVVEILNRNNAMSRTLESIAPNSGGKTWKKVFIDWIDAKCPIPAETARSLALTKASARQKRLQSGEGFRLTLTSPESDFEIHPRGRLLGLGAVH